MKTWMAVLMLGSVLWMPPVPADAFDGVTFSMQDRGGGGGRGAREGRPPREVRNVQPPPAPPVQRERPRGNMTEEDRRQLHRDLEKANRELYRGKR